MKLTKYKLGDLIEQRREKYNGEEELPIRGVSREGFILPKQDGADLSLYNVYYRNDFVFNPARMELNSIALNVYWDKAICSSLYEIFYVSRTDIILPEYLNLFIKRDEFARKCWFEAVGSARNYFRVSNLSEFIIEVPSIDIQQKYVGIYNSMLENQKSYERGLDDLKISCDAFLEQLKNSLPHNKIGPYLYICDEKNSNLDFNIDSVKGISTGKTFIDTKANLNGVSLASYKIVKKNEFAYVADTSRRGDKIALAYNDSENAYLVSSAYTVFRVECKDIVLPEYLFMYFNRSEFDRYSRFNSWGSAREVFSWEDMCDVSIPIPQMEVQESISNIYKAYKQRKEINEKLKSQIKDICPILIKGSIEEVQKEA